MLSNETKDGIKKIKNIVFIIVFAVIIFAIIIYITIK